MNKTRLSYHRFRIGDTVYVWSLDFGRYFRPTVRGLRIFDGSDFWDVSLGRFPDRLVLSADEDPEWIAQYAGVGR